MAWRDKLEGMHCLDYRLYYLVLPMTTLAGGFLVTNYHDGGRKVSKSSLEQGRKNKRDHCVIAVDAWRG